MSEFRSSAVINGLLDNMEAEAPPRGHVVACDRWRNSTLVQHLQGAGVVVLFESELGAADLLLPGGSRLLYVSERDIVAANSHKRKLVCYRNASGASQRLVLVETTGLTEQWFPAVQRFVVFDLGLTLLPVSSQTEASQLITQLVHGEARGNPFRRRTPSQLPHSRILALVQQVPGVGRVKALALLQRFSSVQQLCNAAPAELEPLVGQAAARHINSFFHTSAAGT